jgi:shikimate kinase
VRRAGDKLIVAVGQQYRYALLETAGAGVALTGAFDIHWAAVALGALTITSQNIWVRSFVIF